MALYSLHPETQPEEIRNILCTHGITYPLQLKSRTYQTIAATYAKHLSNFKQENPEGLLTPSIFAYFIYEHVFNKIDFITHIIILYMMYEPKFFGECNISLEEFTNYINQELTQINNEQHEHTKNAANNNHYTRRNTINTSNNEQTEIEHEDTTDSQNHNLLENKTTLMAMNSDIRNKQDTIQETYAPKQIKKRSQAQQKRDSKRLQAFLKSKFKQD